ncbi:MAG TPA: response regulator transcription factor [Lacunisphaera sp.]|jgi:two-component system response regulator DevR|nr:response regulator transcription factor [Lacunisphaera sp.]HQY04855.1 response regulator transcription factor [Lacunisphaera sp.]
MNASPSTRLIRVLLIDDSPIIRLGLRSALEDCPDIQIVGEAGSSAEGLAAVAKHKPDIALLDLHLPDKDGVTTCREIKKSRPQTQVLILTSSSHERNLQEAMSAGALGYLLKDNNAATLASALRSVAGGQPVLDPSLAGQVLNLVKHRGEKTAAAKLSQLSPQERRVVALLADGLTNKEIGDRLGLTEKTVKNYLATIFTKLDITRRSQAAALYVEAARIDGP